MKHVTLSGKNDTYPIRRVVSIGLAIIISVLFLVFGSLGKSVKAEGEETATNTKSYEQILTEMIGTMTNMPEWVTATHAPTKTNVPNYWYFCNDNATPQGWLTKTPSDNWKVKCDHCLWTNTPTITKTEMLVTTTGTPGTLVPAETGTPTPTQGAYTWFVPTVWADVFHPWLTVGASIDSCSANVLDAECKFKLKVQNKSSSDLGSGKVGICFNVRIADSQDGPWDYYPGIDLGILHTNYFGYDNILSGKNAYQCIVTNGTNGTTVKSGSECNIYWQGSASGASGNNTGNNRYCVSYYDTNFNKNGSERQYYFHVFISKNGDYFERMNPTSTKTLVPDNYCDDVKDNNDETLNIIKLPDIQYKSHSFTLNVLGWFSLKIIPIEFTNIEILGWPISLDWICICIAGYFCVKELFRILPN